MTATARSDGTLIIGTNTVSSDRTATMTTTACPDGNDDQEAWTSAVTGRGR
jgi:hypothetical protein